MSEVQIPIQAYNVGLDVLVNYPLTRDDKLCAVHEVLCAAAPAIVVAELRRLMEELTEAYLAAIELDKKSVRATGISAAALKIQRRITELDPGSVEK
jgi:hypothetical protein